MADESYNVPNLADGEVFRVEQTIKRSRFITSVGRTDSVESAKAFIEKIKAEFADARHNCWAYCAGAAGSSDRVGASDDGEPHGNRRASDADHRDAQRNRRTYGGCDTLFRRYPFRNGRLG